MTQRSITTLLSVAFIFSALVDTRAQSFFGLSVNFGDRLIFHPNYSGSEFLPRRSFSPTLVYMRQQKLISNFSLMVGGQFGIAGYQIVFESADTVGMSGERLGFGDYEIFVSRLEAVPGLTFNIGKRELFIGAGGGISYYRVFYELSAYSSSVIHQGIQYTTFEAAVEAPPSGTFLPFAKVYTKLTLTNRLDLAFQYSTHWRSIVNGEFEFYHTKTPESGTISLVPRGVSMVLLYKLRKT